MQSCLQSLTESIANILVGFAVAIVSQVLVFPLYGINIPLSSNFGIGLWFTGISLARSYVIRRIFNTKSK